MIGLVVASNTLAQNSSYTTANNASKSRDPNIQIQHPADGVTCYVLTDGRALSCLYDKP